jgi:hypothetical protein
VGEKRVLEGKGTVQKHKQALVRGDRGCRDAAPGGACFVAAVL